MTQGVQRRVVAIVAGIGLVLQVTAGAFPTAEAQPAYEAEPVLKAAELVPAALLRGPRHRVDEAVPTKGFLAHFTMHSDFGQLQIAGRDLLAVRVAEIGALEVLERQSESSEFVRAAAGAAQRPIEAAANIITRPVETVQGLPEGVSRLFGRVRMGAASLREAAGQSEASTAERTREVAERVGGITATTLGYERERRRIARQLGVDPYTTNPLLAARLDEVAWVAFSGRVSLNLLVAVVVPFSMVLSATSITDNLVWDMPPADLIRLNGEKLAAMGAGEAQVRALIKNRWYSLTVLTALVIGLEGLVEVAGRPEVGTLAATATTEEQARFVAHSVGMLLQHHTAVKPLASLAAPGPVVGRTRDGALVVPAPLDYVAWTERAAQFAGRTDLAAKERGIWLTGELSPRTRRELAAAGWAIHPASLEPAKQ